MYNICCLLQQHKHIIIRVIGEFRERAHCAHKATGVWMMIYMILLCVLANVYLFSCTHF